ncbi:hypothetical protein KGY73_03540 [bacterium]|nr:hypothetical protein [bacterium]
MGNEAPFSRDNGCFLYKEDGWHGIPYRPPAAEGTHWGMGGVRTDGGYPVTGPILKKFLLVTPD